jgi:hypothetical protein
MTTEHEASRTLVKSPPELWAECSDAGSLARHLGEFGEISITRLEPETTVAWEGEHASGTVRIEPSGWGTRVTLTARTRAEAEAETVEPRAVEPPTEEPQAVEARVQGSAAAESPPDERSIKDTPQEEEHAKVEETVEAPTPALAADAGALRVRWRRMTVRMRDRFRSGDSAQAPPEAQAAEEPVNSTPPPAPVPADPPSAPIPANPPQPPAEEGPPEPVAEEGPPEPVAEPAAEPELDAQGILTLALDSLGQAHHRPFSRA